MDFELYEMTLGQAQRIIEYVAQARDGLITKNEMASKIEALVGKLETEIQ